MSANRITYGTYGTYDDLRNELELTIEACGSLYREKEDLERQLVEARELEDELIRKLILNKEGSLSNKEVVLSLFSYFEDQLKEKGK